MKVNRGVAICAVAALLLAGGCQASPAAAGEIVIGADLELSGPGAGIGKVYAQALQLRVEQVNHDGLVGNRKLTLVVRDNRSDAATSAGNISTFAADPAVRALITGGCGECIVNAAKAVNEAKIPTIALARQSNVSAPVKDRKYIFKLAPNADDDATVLVTELAAGALLRVAVVGPEDPGGNELVEALTSKFAKAGVSTVGTEKLGANDANAVAARIAAKNPAPQAVVILVTSPSSAQLAKALRAEGYTGRLMFGSGAADGLFLTGDTAPALDGASLVFTPTLVSDDIIATSPAKASRVAWFRDYLSTYGTYAAWASFAADAVGLIIEAVNRTNSTDRDTLRSAIETARFDGLSGPIRLTPDNHSGLMPQAMTLLVATNGRWRLAS